MPRYRNDTGHRINLLDIAKNIATKGEHSFVSVDSGQILNWPDVFQAKKVGLTLIDSNTPVLIHTPKTEHKEVKITKRK